MPVRLGAGERYCHRPGKDSARYSEEVKIDRREISIIGTYKMSLLVVGSVAFDSVKGPHGSVERMLGGSGTYFSIAASYFTDVRLVGVVGDDFADEHHDVLLKRGICTQGLERVAGKTFFWRSEERRVGKECRSRWSP